MINKKLATKKKIARTFTVALCLSMGLAGCGKKNATPVEEVELTDSSIIVEADENAKNEKKDEPKEEKKEDEKSSKSDKDSSKKDNKQDDKKNDKTDKDKKDNKNNKKKNELVELDKNVTSESPSNSGSASNNTSNGGGSSSKPSAQATAAPTVAPTAQATAAPTVVPTAQATAQPTAVPTAKPSAQPTAAPTATPETTPAGEKFVLDESYSLVWQEDFDGTELNRDDWNVELHAPGWVNSESQAYVDSTDNIYIKDGKLVIQPLKDADGKITSGRINTQNKHDFKYGYFECRAKVPAGAGYLPAFWMMPTDENLYGQWPRCGEIDIMEVMGQETDKVYGTIHFGNPHSESQGTKKLATGDFASDYHTYAVDWQPGSIKWYVDGVLFHEENDWYSTTENVGTVSYPAPFDQPFYMILNVAAGGSWVGDLDETAKFDESSQMVVDYVKVYQKDSYDENVTKPVKDVVLRDPDATGNFINNGSFDNESLTDDVNWKFMTANGGVADASIANNEINITTTNAGTVDYSVQLVQAGLPMKKGNEYTLTFDAKATNARSMGVAVKAPDRGYMAYMSNTADLTSDWQTYTYTFTMTESSDANGRLEYNMGAAGTEGIEIRNVKLINSGVLSQDDLNKKKVLANGSLVYNGEFQEGVNRLDYWDVSNMNMVSVTNVNNSRELCAKGDVVVSQTELAFTDGVDYELSFVARGTGSVKATAAGVSQTFTVTDTNQTYTLKIPANQFDNKDLHLEIATADTLYVDSVKIVEDSLIKNGSFSAGLSGYEFYKYSDGLATAVVDSLSESNAADITINNTGNTDWYIQLKQNNITLEKGQWYNLTFKVKSDLARDIMYAIQRDGSSDDDWTPYTGSKIVSLAGDGEYQTISLDFKMDSETDTKSILSFTMGAVGGKQITSQHRICIDDIVLSKIDAPEVPEITPDVAPEVPEITPSKDPGVNMLDKLADGSAVGTVDVNEGTYTYTIPATGADEWSTQLKQDPVTVVKGKTYKIEFKANSSIDRKVRVLLRDAKQGYQGLYDYVSLKANEDMTYSTEYTWTLDSTKTADFAIFMGTMDTGDAYDSNHTITISDVKVYEVSQNDGPQQPETPADPTEVNLLDSLYKDGNAVGSASFEEGVYTYTIPATGADEWSTQLKQDPVTLTSGKKYRISFKVKSSVGRVIRVLLRDANQGYAGLYEYVTLVADEEYTYSTEYVWELEDTSTADFAIFMGTMEQGGACDVDHTVTISEVKVVEVE